MRKSGFVKKNRSKGFKLCERIESQTKPIHLELDPVLNPSCEPQFWTPVYEPNPNPT
jgi:hypothetical protein